MKDVEGRLQEGGLRRCDHALIGDFGQRDRPSEVDAMGVAAGIGEEAVALTENIGDARPLSQVDAGGHGRARSAVLMDASRQEPRALLGRLWPDVAQVLGQGQPNRLSGGLPGQLRTMWVRLAAERGEERLGVSTRDQERFELKLDSGLAARHHFLVRIPVL